MMTRLFFMLPLLLFSQRVWATPLTFTYDALGRMTVFTLPAGNQVNYTYDANGNRTQEKIIIQAAFDPDADAIPTVADNCSAKSNTSQGDVDNDGKGDACDSLNWAQLVAGMYTTYGNKDGITTELFMANNGLASAAQIGSLANYAGANLVRTREIDGVVFDPSSNRVYFAEQYNNLIRHADLSTGAVTKDAGSGSVWLAGFLDGSGLEVKFNLPQQIAVSADGQWLYIADYGNSAIRRMNTATQQVTTYAGSPGVVGYQDGAAASAQFNWPRGVAVGSDNTVYVADSYNSAVRKISTDGVVSTLFGGPGNTAGMGRPSGLTVIGSALYVADRLAHVIWKIDVNSGSGTVVVGKLGVAGTLDKVPGDQARLGCLLGIDGKGTQLFVSDDCQNNIRQIDISNNYYTTILAGGASGFVDGTFAAARFDIVQSISYDPIAKVLYVADHYNLALRRLHLESKTVSTLIGAPEKVNRHVDGEGPVARFSNPLGLAIIDGFNLLIADSGNCLIRKVSLDPNFGKVVSGKFNHTVNVTTIAGKKWECPCYPTGITIDTTDAADGASAYFYRPDAIVIDDVGQYAYIGSRDNLIRRLTLATGATTWIAGTPLAATNQDGVGHGSSFGSITSIVFLPDPALYILSDTAIRRLSLAAADYGTVTTIFGHAAEKGTQNGVGTNARFTAMQSSTLVNRNGVNYLYVTDAGANTVRAVNLKTQEVTTIAGSGNAGSVDGVGAQALFDTPLGITAITFPDGAQYLYVGDFHTPKMRMIDLDTNEVTSVSGSGAVGSGDGIGAQGDWSAAVDMVYLPQHNRVFVLDHINSALRQLTPDIPK